MFNPLIFVLIALVVLVLGVLGYRQQQKRRQELASFAASQGWDFDPERNYEIERRYAAVDAFRRGDARYAYNTVRGSVSLDGVQCPLVLGDYHYQETTGSGKNRRTTSHNFSYVIFHLPYNCGCQLRIRQEGLFDKMASMLGFDDIDFESDEFSRRFHVKSSNKKFAYDVLHPRMMEFLLDTPPPTILIADRICFLSEGSRCWPVEKFAEFLGWGDTFFATWPRFLVDDLRGRECAVNFTPTHPR